MTVTSSMTDSVDQQNGHCSYNSSYKCSTNSNLFQYAQLDYTCENKRVCGENLGDQN